MKTRAVITGVGARTPIGLTAQQTAFMHRAAHVAMQQSALLDHEGEPACFAALSTLDPRTTGLDRLVQLAAPALKEAGKPLSTAKAPLNVKMVVCLDDFIADQSGHEASNYGLVAELSRTLGPAIKPSAVDAVVRGSASLGVAIGALIAELDRGVVDAVLIGGVHSDYDPERIKALSQAGRLFTPDRLDSLIPGESAAFALLMTEEAAARHELQPLALVHAWGEGVSACRPDNDESAFGSTGLVTSVRQAAVPMTEGQLQCGWVLCDLTFETMGHHELQAMMTRTHKLWCEPQVLEAPAQRLGYLGAAAMPLSMVLAAEAWRAGFAPHERAMCCAGSDDGQRAAVLLSAPTTS